MEQYKTCTKCGQTLSLSSFYKRAVSKDGHKPTCKECDKEAKRDYYKANPRTKRKKYKSNYCDLAPEKKAKKIAWNKQWNKANKDKRTLAMAKRRALKKGNGVFLVTDKEIRRLQKLKCFYCGQNGGEVDHVIPLTKGGRHSIGNLLPACRSCNSSKNNRFITEWIKAKR